VSAPQAPRLDPRRAAQFAAELLERARVWIPSWSIASDERDFGYALLQVAARFSSEVAERLDKAGDKMRLGLLDWLGIAGEAARPARLPVVFKLTDSVEEAVPALAPTKLQAQVGDASVILETDTGLNVVPGTLQQLIAVDADQDALYLSPPGLPSLVPLEPLPTRWQLKSFASAGATRVQLDPPLGLVQDMVIQLGGRQYRIAGLNSDLVTLDPPLDQDQPTQSVVDKVTVFAPYDDTARNRQQHQLYLGHTDLFNIEAAVAIEVLGAKPLAQMSWEYWGKRDGADEVAWQLLPLASQDVQAGSEGLVLSKPKGSIELSEQVPGSNSRWIRARCGSLAPGSLPVSADGFQVRVNCVRGSSLTPTSGSSPAAEAMANTTPLVLNTAFYPFGKEPRQFDTFYLGSAEAFSKGGAGIDLNFDLADTTFTALSAVRQGAFGNVALVGVAHDGALHVLEVNPLTGVIGKLRGREPLRPPLPDGPAGESSGVALDQRPPWRAPVWPDTASPAGFNVGVTSGPAVWAWHEDHGDPADPKNNAWTAFGNVPGTTPSSSSQIADLVYLADAATPVLVALRDQGMAIREMPPDAQWKPVATGLNFDALVPVLVDAGSGFVTAKSVGMVGVAGGDLYTVRADGVCTKVVDAALPPAGLRAAPRPVAVQSAGALMVAVALQASPSGAAMFHSAYGGQGLDFGPGAQLTGFDAVNGSSGLSFLAAVKRSAGGSLFSWAPQKSAATNITLFQADIPLSTAPPDGAPTAIAGHVVIPGEGGDLLAATLDFSMRRDFTANVQQGIVTPASAPGLLVNDVVTIDAGPPFTSQIVTQAGTTGPGQVLYPLNSPFPAGQAGALFAFRPSTPAWSGDTDHVNATLALDPLDDRTGVRMLVELADGIHRVTSITPGGGVRTASIDPPPAADAVGVPYRSSIAVSGRLAPFMLLNGSNNSWPASLLDGATLVFPGANPQRQTAQAFSVDSANRPLLVVMNDAWSGPPVPAAAAKFTLDAALGTWSSVSADTSAKPELSWEYWNGKGWWKLDVDDRTLYLKKSGTLHFTMPGDVAPTDWSGRTNYWIRARLVGGDYGREEVSVATSPPDSSGVTHQTIERSTRNIHAPSVLKLGIAYSICNGVLPTFVVTQDGGSTRDQSDANRTGGAQVVAFVPLSIQLGRVSGPAGMANDPCQPDCDCPSTSSTAAGVSVRPNSSSPSGTAATAHAAPAPSVAPSGRALYLGFDGRLTGEPVNVLCLVEERNHEAFAPLIVEALVADRFIPLVAGDKTRALGEDGVLSVAFTLDPTPRELFGQTLRWLRLAPTGGDPSNWKPALSGAYLNAVWASAQETLTRELVGSSEGAPNLTLFLARPPLLHDTLELRVNEPLGDEERAALQATSPDVIVSSVDGLPGDWVLWRRVTDPGDWSATDRVYGLDETTGEISFGDGQHGAIPPIGRDCIVAFSYRRTEPPTAGQDAVPGNSIAPRTQLSLVSPIAGVESVVAADQAAGGSPAEAVDRVLRFGVARLRHRERAVTASDLEDIALESSPDIVQAHCFIRGSTARLVVVMRGPSPVPNAAQIRELRSLLLAQSPVPLTSPQALRVAGPGIRWLRLDLTLMVASLDDAGDVARSVRGQIQQFFDAASGGPGGDGWGLGDSPTEADIALALADVERLEGIETISLLEVVTEDGDSPWPAAIDPTELVMVAKDPVRFTFQVVEIIA
jgi:hypothetical protein